jgi:hypothetical protein
MHWRVVVPAGGEYCAIGIEDAEVLSHVPVRGGEISHVIDQMM